MTTGFDGRVVVVTGATGELGHAVVVKLIELGAVCHVPVRSLDRAGRLGGLDSGSVRVVPGVDVSSEESVAGFYRGLPSLWASVHCAGAFAMSSVDDISLDEFRRMMSVNGESCFLCCREAIRRMRGNDAAGVGAGRIVNVAAIPAVEPRRGAGMAAYAASKAVVASLTLALAEEVKNLGIWLNAVAPSLLDTPANRKAMPGADFDAWPRVEEVAETIAYLASPGNRVARSAVVPVFGRT